MNHHEEVQAVCGATLSLCSWVVASMLDWAPVLSVIAMVVAIVSGLFAILVSVKKLRSHDQ